jgi:hypothetical protein
MTDQEKIAAETEQDAKQFLKEVEGDNCAGFITGFYKSI